TTVRNDSIKIVRSVTLAAFIDKRSPYYSVGDRNAVVSSPPLGTWIPPGETRAIESHVIDMASLQAYRPGTVATLGVVNVDFADGSKWTFDVPATNGFSSGAPSQAPLRPGNGIKNPVPISRADPKYTQEARQAKIQGDVEVDAIVLANG